MNKEDNKKKEISVIIILTTIIIIGCISGCVCSINIQKYNNNSNQEVEQHSKSKMDSTNFNVKELW